MPLTLCSVVQTVPDAMPGPNTACSTIFCDLACHHSSDASSTHDGQGINASKQLTHTKRPGKQASCRRASKCPCSAHANCSLLGTLSTKIVKLPKGALPNGAHVEQSNSRMTLSKMTYGRQPLCISKANSVTSIRSATAASLYKSNGFLTAFVMPRNIVNQQDHSRSNHPA